MESHKYLTGRWLNGRKITVAVSACLLIAAVVKITNLVMGADRIDKLRWIRSLKM